MPKPNSQVAREMRAKYKEAGLVSMQVWVPPEDRDRLQKEATALRKRYLAKRLLSTDEGTRE